MEFPSFSFKLIQARVDRKEIKNAQSFFKMVISTLAFRPKDEKSIRQFLFYFQLYQHEGEESNSEILYDILANIDRKQLYDYINPKLPFLEKLDFKEVGNDLRKMSLKNQGQKNGWLSTRG